ncbi:MAG: synthase subunit [Cohnella sp.]|jgi:F-type H+-transporting ATPase subunit a|nr:synthase subunit [Cohnella sp.]
MAEHLVPRVTIFGMVFDLAAILTMAIVSLIVFFLIYFATRNMTSRTPQGLQNFLEWVIDFVRGIAGQLMESKVAERYVGLGLTLFLYIFISNQIGLFGNIVTVHEHPSALLGITSQAIEAAKAHGQQGVTVSWWKSPTATISVPLALAFLVLFYSHWLGLRRSVRGYAKSYVNPHWLMLPLNLVEELSKFLSFPLRLYGNIFAGEVLLWVLLPTIVHGGISAVLSVPLLAWIGYSIFVGAIQAFIFTMLTMVYISHRVVSHDPAH